PRGDRPRAVGDRYIALRDGVARRGGGGGRIEAVRTIVDGDSVAMQSVRGERILDDRLRRNKGDQVALHERSAIGGVTRDGAAAVQRVRDEGCWVAGKGALLRLSGRRHAAVASQIESLSVGRGGCEVVPDGNDRRRGRRR